MDRSRFVELLVPLAGLVFVGGWVLALAAFFIIGTETCSDVDVPLAGSIRACQDTTANAVILLTVIGFAATVGSLFLLGMRHMLQTLAEIEKNTRTGS